VDLLNQPCDRSDMLEPIVFRSMQPFLLLLLMVVATMMDDICR
jgi:hypothetical protein